LNGYGTDNLGKNSLRTTNDLDKEVMMPKKTMGPQTWIFPMPALLVGAMVDDKPNFMTAAWGGIACSDPTMLSVAIRPNRYTLQGIREHETFSINIPSTALAEKTDFCGVHSGKKADKSAMFTIFYGKESTVPLIEECPCVHECRVRQIVELGSHVLVIGEITETHINEDCLLDGKPDIKKIDPLVYIAGEQKYYNLGGIQREAFSS
jgi:flavin reductase (DIM6/NTAB) family NADH-FMN oxidoreductase RutF